MLGEEYTLKYTEQFRDDIAEAIGYIVNELRNPIAAQKLKDVVSDHTIEFRRFLYARRNLPKYLVTADNDG